MKLLSATSAAGARPDPMLPPGRSTANGFVSEMLPLLGTVSGAIGCIALCPPAVLMPGPTRSTASGLVNAAAASPLVSVSGPIGFSSDPPEVAVPLVLKSAPAGKLMRSTANGFANACEPTAGWCMYSRRGIVADPPTKCCPAFAESGA